MTSFHYAMAFGYRWQSEIPLPAFEAIPSVAKPDIGVSIATGEPPHRGEVLSVARLRQVEGGSRFVAEQQATIDTYKGSRVEVYPGRHWRGEMPAAFFGSVTGALSTWRGDVAMHGSSVEMDGKGVLICGRSGAGKSTLAAALIAKGARLISDDLSVLHAHGPSAAPVLYAGKRTMRLFPDVVKMMAEKVALPEYPRPSEGKILVVPPRIDAKRAVPLALVLVLGEDPAVGREKNAFELLRSHLFRRLAYAQIPGLILRLARLTAIAGSLPVFSINRNEARDQQAFSEIARRAEQIVLHALNSDIVR